MEKFKVVVAGTRTFHDYKLLRDELDRLLSRKLPDVIIISGGAKGADKIAEQYAHYHDLEMWVMLADWDKHGRAAGPLRNQEMAKVADAVVVFWDGVSRGTMHMIDAARAKKKSLRIIRYTEL